MFVLLFMAGCILLHALKKERKVDIVIEDISFTVKRMVQTSSQISHMPKYSTYAHDNTDFANIFSYLKDSRGYQEGQGN